MSGKSLEQRLFEAYASGRGMRLTASDVFELVAMNDAIGTRITNAAAGETVGSSCVGRHGSGETWAQFCDRAKGGA